MWWQNYPTRLAQEHKAIWKYYPGVRVSLGNIPAKYCLTCWEDENPTPSHIAVFANIVTRTGCGYPVVMVYPCNYPNRIPSVWPLKDVEPHPPVHCYGDGRLCLTENEYDTDVTGLIVLGWAFGWFNCYDIWLRTGKFPEHNYGKIRVR